MEERRWSSGYDRDAYDDDPATIQLLNMQGDTIEAGLRLTPRSRIEDTMSWSWLPEELQMRAREVMSLEEGVVWDLTRLVPGHVSPERSTESLVELFGAGYALSHKVDKSPRWIFATTVPFYRYFSQQGISFTPIVRGKFSERDKHDSILCYTDPIQGTQYLEQAEAHGMTLNAVHRGIEAAKELSGRN
ncbi:hypothetical protein D3C85_1194790 [compost metagenome]